MLQHFILGIEAYNCQKNARTLQPDEHEYIFQVKDLLLRVNQRGYSFLTL